MSAAAHNPRNPYDRRQDPARRGDKPTDEFAYTPYDPLDDGRRAYSGFSLARLEELLRDEYARGYQCGEGTMERNVEEKILPDVKRKVWAQGYAAGRLDGYDAGRVEASLASEAADHGADPSEDPEGPF